ncbi:MAG: cupin-like domain-containing protein [Burkholderiaceae bacterium]|nr:cupin-like domain-containing protein [Microbacteriaceae bacterium]
MTPKEPDALARLVGDDTAGFAREHWGRAPLLTRSADGVADLFSAGAVDELIADRAMRTPFVRMAKEGVVLSAERFTGGAGYGAEVADQVRADAVLTEFTNGATLVLQGLHRTWPALADFTTRLVRELGHPCQVNAYVTPASARGFDPHYDVHDVFVVQVHGEKHWRIHEPVLENPAEPWTTVRAEVEARAEKEPAIDAVFAPGDVLYLPRGWIHSATALGGTSIHLTIGVAAFTGSDIADRALALAAGADGLRASLPLGFDPADVADLGPLVDHALDALAARFAEPEFRAEVAASVAGTLGGRLLASARPEPVRPLATADALAVLDRSTPVGWRRGTGATVVREGDAVRIVRLHPRPTVRLPVEAAAALEALAAGHPLRAGSLPGLDESSSLVVSRRLLREGILVPRPDGAA